MEIDYGQAVGRKDYPITMRLPEADIALIDRAAIARGRSRTDFVREAAVRAVEDVLMGQRLVRMSAKGFAELIAPLEHPSARRCSQAASALGHAVTIGTDD